MALLTADDVLNKKFQPTKFREGYDQDEVDDFLDEIVNTLRVVGGENEELKARLEEAQRRIAELGGEPTGVDVAGVGDTQQLSAVVEPEAEEAPAEEPAAEAEPGQAEAPAQAES
ncbi:MAG: DivIVA domain-containing protein, partial [Actinomycetales bacterium]|nr:DivIVA domain-containing protein [Actinomycetales bacterium]